jgi:hypothetical protein
MGRRAVVGYAVPVQVIVDVERGKVERVVVVDDEIELDEEAAVRALGLADDGVTDQATSEAALRIAEDPMVIWPRWQFGF